jgi:long-chain acyl-CoA synthetase
MKTYNAKRFSSFRDIVNYVAETFKSKTAFQIKKGEKEYKEITFEDFRLHYYRLCTYLLKKGLKGARIAVSGKNCYEWVISYLAAATVGVAVPIDKELSGEDIAEFMKAGECSLIFCEETISEKLSEDKIPRMVFGEVMPLAETASVPAFHEIDSIQKSPDEMSVLIFTSGTTGSSKGVMLSQNNICSNIYQTLQMVKVKQDDKTMSILPLHHTYECTLDCILILSCGATVCYAESLRTVARNIREYSPSILVVVPELLAVLCRRIKAGIIEGCPKAYKHYFEELGIAEALKKVPFFIRVAIKGKVKKTLGGKLRLFIVGAAELDTSIVNDFTALGIRTLQGYGLTECSPLLAGNGDFYFNPASTGIAIPGVELKIDNPNAEGVGEIIARGDNIMLGYYNDEEATRAVIRDGWFHTGDLGKMDPDGALYIKGRIKNVIVAENGKNIFPEELENRISAYEEVQDIIVVSDKKSGRVQVKAKIYPNFDFIKNKLGHAPSNAELESEIRRIVEAVNSKIPSYKHVKMIEILTEALEKTTTRKIKRFGSNVE